jgi:hypothetical protein
MEHERKLEDRRVKDSLVVIGALFVLFLLTSWYSKLGEKKEIFIEEVTDIPYSRLNDPDFSREYFSKKQFLLNKRKTMIPFIATYDTLKVVDLGWFSKAKP